MEITKIVEWDMGHRVPNHNSKCRNLHGHRYKAEITLTGDIICLEGESSEGMVIDFSDIKRIANNFIDGVLDHGYMFQKGDSIGEKVKELGYKHVEVDFVPTAENIVKWIFNALEHDFFDRFNTNLRLSKIVLFETPTSYVKYER